MLTPTFGYTTPVPNANIVRPGPSKHKKKKTNRLSSRLSPPPPLFSSGDHSDRRTADEEPTPPLHTDQPSRSSCSVTFVLLGVCVLMCSAFWLR
ncbi:hypothetical protein NL676_033230 [Syzygium grande]|nr:hypothetical protein NL676_033230 [Syzygium grande]